MVEPMVRPLARSTVLTTPARAPRSADVVASDVIVRAGPAARRPHEPASRAAEGEARRAWLHALSDDPSALTALVERLRPEDSHAQLGFLVPRLIERLSDTTLDAHARDTHLRLLAAIGTPHARSALAQSLDPQALAGCSMVVLRAQLHAAAAQVLLEVDPAASLYTRLQAAVRSIGARGVPGEVREAASALALLGRHPALRARAAGLLREDLGLTHEEPLASGALALAAHALQLDEREALTARARPGLRALGSPAALTLERELAARTVERGSVLAFLLSAARAATR